MIQMLSPVNLDDQLRFNAGEVSNETRDWKLPPKFESLQPSIAKM